MYIYTNGIKINYETFGSSAHPALILLMGNSAQGMMWDDPFCQRLSKHDFYVIRFDYRDTGLSSCIDYDKNPYNLTDLANDVLGLMDKLAIKQAHFVGLSMGGALAQLLAYYHHQRVLSITLMMTTPDLSIKNNAFKGMTTPGSILPPPSSEFVNQVIALNKTPAKTEADKIKQIVENWRLMNGAKATFDEHYWFELIKKTMLRESSNPEAKDLKFANLSNHTKAQITSQEPNIHFIDKIKVPCLIIHGQEDPIFPPLHAKTLAQHIKNSHLRLIDKMGHALNPIFWDELIEAICEHIKNVP